MVHLDTSGRGQAPLGFGGGGGLGGILFPAAAAGLAGWAAFDLLAVSIPLAAATAGYIVLVIAFLIALTRNYVTHDGVVRFFLIASVFIAALTAFAAFRAGFLRFVTGDTLMIVLLLAALYFGLWAALSWLMRAVAIAAVVLLAAAPFSEEVKRNEKWMVAVEVWDQSCARARYPTTKCQVISDLTGEVLDEKGPTQASEFGSEYYTFDGNPFGKKARCEATSDQGSGVAIAEPTWIFASFAQIRLSASGESQLPCTGD